MLRIRSGRLADAERLADECAEQGRLASDARTDGFHRAHLVAIRAYQGRIAELADTLAESENSPILATLDNASLAACAVAAASAGNRRLARTALARLRGTDLARLPRSSTWLAAMHGIAEATALLDDADMAGRVYDLLLPFASLPIMLGFGVVCFGSAHHALGVAALTTGAADQVVSHFRAAVDRNTALGHWPAPPGPGIGLARRWPRSATVPPRPNWPLPQRNTPRST